MTQNDDDASAKRLDLLNKLVLKWAGKADGIASRPVARRRGWRTAQD